MQWVHWASDSVATYYGRFPVPNVRLSMIPSSGQRCRGGKTFGESDGGSFEFTLGVKRRWRTLPNDWMLTHEMVHLGFPSVADNHHWIEEGMATYVEPIARVRAGHLDAHRDVVRTRARPSSGLAEPGDKGLDNTHSWARTYWGGALFCFLADVEFVSRRTTAKVWRMPCAAS